MSQRMGIAGIVVAASALGFGTWTRPSLGEAVRPAPPPVVITPEATQAAGSVSEFTFDLYRRVAAEREGNIFISPYSVAGALLMVAEGARGDTALEIGNVLHFPDSARNAGDASRPWRTIEQLTAFGTLNRSLTPADEAGVAPLRLELKKLEAQLATLQAETQKALRSGRSGDFRKESALVDRVNALRSQLDPYELRIANAAWVDAEFPLRKEYLAAVTEGYGGTAKPVDFRHKPDQEREAINAWAAEQTKGKIKSVLEPGSATSDMRLLLTNAVYFKGEWTDPFDESGTQEQDFIAADGEKSKCRLMSAWRNARFAELRPDGTLNGLEKAPAPEGSPYAFEWKWSDNPDGVKVLELPYKGDRLSLVAILPGRPDGIEELEANLNAAALATWMGAAAHQEVRMYVPRFRMENRYDLAGDLAALGMRAAFSPGGLTGVSDDPDAKLLAISGAIHVTFVELNEKGTEAAAVTAFPAPASAAPDREPPKPPAVFRGDHPFVFLIRDTKSGAVLFIGRMADAS